MRTQFVQLHRKVPIQKKEKNRFKNGNTQKNYLQKKKNLLIDKTLSSHSCCDTACLGSFLFSTCGASGSVRFTMRNAFFWPAAIMLGMFKMRIYSVCSSVHEVTITVLYFVGFTLKNK